MKKVIILAFLTMYFGAFAQDRCEILVAAHNEQFISMKFSDKSKRLFVTTSKGQMIVLNNNDKVIDTLTFASIGTVDLDNDGKFGTYSDANYNVFLFNQQTLRVIKIIQVTHQTGQGALRAVFTKHGLLFSTFTNVYKFETDGTISNVAPSFGILDYDFKNDVLLLGQWNPDLKTDRKVKNLFTSSSADLTKRTHVLTHSTSFELYSYLLNNSNMVMSYDGKGNYYTVTLDTQKQTVQTQTDLAENERKFSLAKINDSTVMVVSRAPLAFNFHKILSVEPEQTVVVRESVVDNQLTLKNNDIYYISSGGNGNKLIAIK